MMKDGLIFGDDVRAFVQRRPSLAQHLKLYGYVRAELWRPSWNHGLRLVDVQEGFNLIVDAGINHILDTSLSGTAQISSYFLGLKDTGAPAAADTMASHAGWATITPYSNVTDPAWTEDNTGADEQVSNSGAPAAFNINATDEVFGAFLKDNNTKGGATGLLVAANNFAASLNVVNGDTLNVTYTISATG